MITGIIGVLTDRVQDMEPRSQIVWQLPMWSIITAKVLKWLACTILDDHHQLSQSAPDWTTEFDCCEERESHLRQLYSISSNIGKRANTVMRSYDGIRTWFLWLQWWCLFVAGILWIHGATGWTVWALSGDQRIQHEFKARGGSIDASYPHVGMDSIWLSDSPNWVWQVCDSLSECICTHGGSRGGRTVWAGELVSTCKAFDFWLCNPSVSGRGGSGPGSPSGMPRECTWITAGEETCSEGGCTLYIQILGATAIDDLLASEQVVWMFFLRVGVRTGLPGATVEGITDGEWDRPQALDGRAGSSGGNGQKKVPKGILM